MAKKGENKNPKCATVIPSHWPKFTGPACTPGMTVSEARAAWYAFLRLHRQVGPTPRIPRGHG